MTAPEPAALARQRLYKERAEWAEFESEIAEGKKYFTVGGWAWKIAEFLDREAKEARAEIQEEIDAMTKPHDQWNSTDIADYARRAMYIETQDYSDLPDANLPPLNWEWRVYTVVCIALFLAVLVVVWRVV